jgi:hypothetical protein
MADMNRTTSIIMRIIELLLKEGWIVWMDSYYNLLELARNLKIACQKDCVMTLKLNRRSVPEEAKDTKLKKEDIYTAFQPVSAIKCSNKQK